MNMGAGPFSFSGMPPLMQHGHMGIQQHMQIGGGPVGPVGQGVHLQPSSIPQPQNDRHVISVQPSIIPGPPRLRENSGISRVFLLGIILLMAGVTATTTMFIATNYAPSLERPHIRRSISSIGSISDNALIAGAVAGAAAGAQAGDRVSKRSLLLRRLAVLRTNDRGEATLHDLLSAFPEWSTTGSTVEALESSRMVIQLAAALSEIAREMTHERAD